MKKLLLPKKKIMSRPSLWAKYQAEMHQKESGHQKMFVYADGIHYGVDCMECPFRVRYEFRRCEDPKIHKGCDNITSEEEMHWQPYKVKNWKLELVKGGH